MCQTNSQVKTKTEQHTPTPWRIQDTGENHPMYLIGKDGTLVGDIYWRLDGLKNFQRADGAREDAAFIVRAVNSHEALLSAAKRIISQDGKDRPIGSETLADRRALVKAIIQAEGGK